MSLVFVLADTPLLENRIYLHLSIFRESLLFESQFVTTYYVVHIVHNGRVILYCLVSVRIIVRSLRPRIRRMCL